MSTLLKRDKEKKLGRFPGGKGLRRKGQGINMDGNVSLNNSEWCIMEALWHEQPKTLMQLVHEMKEKQGWSKSTTNTMLRRMQEKGYIRYEEGEKARLYCTNLKREEVVLKETKSFLKRTYGGSIGMLVNTFVESNQLSEEDMEQLWEILHRAEENKDFTVDKKSGRR